MVFYTGPSTDQSCTSDSSHYLGIFWVSLVLGSYRVLRKDTPMKNPQDQEGLQNVYVRTMQDTHFIKSYRLTQNKGSQVELCEK